MEVCVCMLLCFIKPIFGNCYGPGVMSLQGTWGGRILTLHLDYVAGYTGPLIFLFERRLHVCEVSEASWRGQTCKQNKRTTRTRNSRKRRICNMRPEREILKNGKRSRFAKHENSKQKYAKPELPKNPSKCRKNKSKSGKTKTKSRTKPLKKRNPCTNWRRGGMNATIRKQHARTQLLAVLNRCNMVSCNALHARGRQEALLSAWRASKHRC